MNIGGHATIAGAVSVGSTLDVAGNTSIGGTSNITGKAEFEAACFCIRRYTSIGGTATCS